MEVCEDTCLGKYWVNSWSKNSRKIKTERKIRIKIYFTFK